MGRHKKIPKHKADVVLSCSDVSESVDYYSNELGFRLDTIFPADAPRVATMSGFGLRLQLESDNAHRGQEHRQPPRDKAFPIVTEFDESAFAMGRAGMQYRDLIPGRFGGRFVASHIRIPDGGPVPDYVHYHDIEFQLIYCIKGWVRVVYEGQGGPMLLQPGDCFLQPPLIRHRVLECSDALEVIEMTCPAEHPTSVDHDMILPTSENASDRKFGRQRFLFHEASSATWLPWIAAGLEYRDLGIAAASGDIASGITVRRSGAASVADLGHDREIRFLFVIAGSAELLSEKQEPVNLEAGGAVAMPPGQTFALRSFSSEFEALEVTAPAL